MPGIKLLTKLDAKICLKLAWRAAQDLGFSVPAIEDASNRFTATKGSAFVSMLAGALAPYCEFQIIAETYSDANEIVLEKNVPWIMSGKVGVGKVNRQAQELIDTIARAIEKDGGTILERKEY